MLLVKGFYNTPENYCWFIYSAMYLICIQTTHSEVNNNYGFIASRSVNMVIECIKITGLNSIYCDCKHK